MLPQMYKIRKEMHNINDNQMGIDYRSINQ